VIGLVLLGLRQWMLSAHLARTLLWLRVSLVGVEWLVIFLAAGAAVAATNRAVAWVHLGEPATIRGAYLSILPRLGRYLWLMTVVFLVVWVPVGFLYLGFFGEAAYLGVGLGTQGGTRHAHMDPHTAIVFGVVTMAIFLLMIPAFVYAILMGLRYALALPACVLEDLNTRAALRRGIDLSKAGRGRIFVLGLLVGVIKVGVVSISQGFFFIAAFKHHGQVGAGLTAISQVIGFFTNTFLGPIYATGITLLYYDQRVRHEGYDIEWMMQSAGLAVPPAADSGQHAVTAAMAAGGAQWETAMDADLGAELGRRQEPEGAHG
jgi:hypothetical protein